MKCHGSLHCCSLQTREELREALEAEMRAFSVDKVGLLFVVFFAMIAVYHKTRTTSLLSLKSPRFSLSLTGS